MKPILDSLFTRLDDVIDDFYPLHFIHKNHRVPYSVYEKADTCIVDILLPGRDKSQITVDVVKDTLRVTSLPVGIEDDKSIKFLYCNDKVELTLDVSKYDTANATSSYTDGILRVKFPFKQECSASATSIPIT